ATGQGYPLDTLLKMVDAVPAIRAIKDWAGNVPQHETASPRRGAAAAGKIVARRNRAHSFGTPGGGLPRCGGKPRRSITSLACAAPFWKESAGQQDDCHARRDATRPPDHLGPCA